MFIKKIIYTIVICNFFLLDVLARDFIIIQSTTSTHNSGLLDTIESAFENKFNIDLRFVSVGTGQAIVNGKNGDGDILMVHSTEDEIQFVKDGYGLERFEIMYNDFVIIGPKHDPFNLRNTENVIEVMHKLKSGKASFLSRDDNSGTHKKELLLWEVAGIEITKNDKWYLRNGLGMGTTLNMASEMDAHTISDRGTWLSFNNKNFLDILFQGDQLLFNPYGAIPINPNKFSHVEYKKSMIFINWLLSNEGQTIINGYKLHDQQLFYTD